MSLVVTPKPAQIDITSPPDSIDGTDAADPSVYLTPDALMAYCQTRLQGIDSQVSTYMTQQENINWEQSGIQSILNTISTDSSAISGSGSIGNEGTCQALEQQVEDLITQIQAKDPGCSALGQLETLHDTIMATGTGPYQTTSADGSVVQHGYYNGSNTTAPTPPNGPTQPSSTTQKNDDTIDATEFTDFTNTLTGIQSSLGQNAQLGMIQIQSLMSDRTTAIQLTTNILQAFNDGTSKIVANVGQG
jgi:hypothetical protein